MAKNYEDQSKAFLYETKSIIEHLEKEEEIEKEVIKEQRDAEEKLAEALQGLQDESHVLRAVFKFKSIDTQNETHSQVHQQVEALINDINKIDDAAQLEKEVEKLEQLLAEIERAFEELEDAYEKSQKDLEDEQEVEKDLEDIEGIIEQLQEGGKEYMSWAGRA